MRPMMWESESGYTYDIVNDRDVFRIDEDNGVLIVRNYGISGDRVAVLLFFGPNTVENSTKWAEHYYKHNYLCETKKALKEVFNLEE